MSNAWEVTMEDVITTLNVNGIDQTQFLDDDEWVDFVDECIGCIDHNAIEHVALRGDNLIEQSDLALEEIETQLHNNGRL